VFGIDTHGANDICIEFVPLETHCILGLKHYGQILIGFVLGMQVVLS